MYPIYAAVLALCSAGASAQINIWTTPVSGNWATPTGWNLGHKPVLAETVFIDNGATVYFTSGITQMLESISIASEKTFTGSMEVSGGTINSDGFFVGYAGTGSLLITGTANIQTVTAFGIGIESAFSNGYAQLDSGTIDVGILFAIGNTGFGEFVQNGGTVNAGYHVSAASGNGNASVTLNAGTFDVVNGITWGNNGHTHATVAGTIITSNALDLSPNSGATATLNITDGSITTGEFRVAWDGLATATQSGGTVTATNLRLGNGSGNGTYNLAGGTLNSGQILRTDSGIATFTMTGGTLNITAFGDAIFPFTLAPTGGTITPGGASIATTTVHGDLTLAPATTIDLQIQGTNDQLAVNGTVTLAGTLSLSLNGPSSPPDTHTLVSNDGADPIVGQFDGLPEGSEITLLDGATPHDFTLSYVGGDGNDVILLNTDCLPDMNGDGILDNGDIGTFIILFLASDLAADMNGDGILDNGDVGNFISLFLAGC